MSNLKASNAAYFSYLIVSFTWYSCLLFAVLTPVMIMLAYTGTSDFLSEMALNFPVSTEVILFSPENAVSFMDIDSAVASVKLSYLAENFITTFFITSGLMLMGIGGILFGLYQLRSLLKNIRNDVIFDPQNTNRIKKMAIVILVLSPIQWIYHMVLTEPFSDYVQNYNVEINIGSADFGFITTALLIYTLALIFEKGYEQYEELKLTV